MIEIRVHGQHTVYEAVGDLDSESVAQLRSVVMDVIETAAGGHVIDCSGLEFVDSSGVGLLVSMFKQARAFRQPLVLAGLQGQPLETLQMLKIDQTIPGYPNLQEALQALSDGA